MNALRATLGRGRRALTRRNQPPIVRSVIEANLTYLSADALVDLRRASEAVERERLDGVIVEAGTALGGSAIVMASAKSPGRPMLAFDMFGMIPPPGPRDGDDVHDRYDEIVRGDSAGIGGDQYYGYRTDLRGDVERAFADHGVPIATNAVTLVQGLYEDTLHIDAPIALAHVDCDWYDSVTCCLERIVPKLVLGGRIVIDDYDAWSGCRDAVDDFVRDRGTSEGLRMERHVRAQLVRAS